MQRPRTALTAASTAHGGGRTTVLYNESYAYQRQWQPDQQDGDRQLHLMRRSAGQRGDAGHESPHVAQQGGGANT